MRAAFAIAALAGAAIAAPSYGTGYGQPKEVKNVVVVVETVVETVYVTEGYEIPSATPTPEAPTSAPAAPTTTVVYEAPKSSYVYEEPAKSSAVYEAPASSAVYEAPTSSAVYEAPTSTPAPVVTPTPTPTPAPAPPAESGYMGVVSEWRAKLGLSDLACDSKLEANAMDTVVRSNGQMVHHLNAGTYGQVLAPGKEGTKNFENVFVGGWLCEKPNMAGLDGVCSTMSSGWAYEGQTGHADILTSPNYSKIGCALHEGIWCCDLA